MELKLILAIQHTILVLAAILVITVSAVCTAPIHNIFDDNAAIKRTISLLAILASVRTLARKPTYKDEASLFIRYSILGVLKTVCSPSFSQSDISLAMCRN
jgi:hypothetical protein